MSRVDVFVTPVDVTFFALEGMPIFARIPMNAFDAEGGYLLNGKKDLLFHRKHVNHVNHVNHEVCGFE